MRAQIWRLAGQGVKPTEIIAQLGYSRSAVYKHFSQIPQSGEEWPDERMAKLQRIHDAALGVIADAFGAGINEIRALLLGRALPASPRQVAHEPVASDTPSSLQTPAAPSVRLTEHKARPGAGVRTFRFVETNGQFLRWDGRGFTTEPVEAWEGRAEQVAPARKSLRDAKFCKSREVQ